MSPAPLPYFLLHDVGKQHRGELTVTCDYTDNRKCYVGGGRGREEVKFPAPGLPAAPAGMRYKCCSWSCWSIISSLQRSVLKTCCHWAFHPGSAVSERTRWEGLRVFGERLPETQLQWAQAHKVRATHNQREFLQYSFKYFYLRKFLEILCLACNSTIFCNSSLRFSSHLFLFFNDLASVEWGSKSELFSFAQSFSAHINFQKSVPHSWLLWLRWWLPAKSEVFSFRGMNTVILSKRQQISWQLKEA